MIVLSPSQDKACDAFRAFLKDPSKFEFLLSGFAGTGKSFLVTYLIDLVRDEYRLIRLISPTTPPTNFHFTATTNKAAHVLSDMVGGPAQTIHQCLGLTIQTNWSTGKPYLVQKNDCKDLSYSVLVIDESSMINRELLEIIRTEARKFKECKILYVGDSYQLPPVKENTCPIFHNVPETYFLTDIQRQAKHSPIISLSNKYREILDAPATHWPEIIPDHKNIHHYTNASEWKHAIKTAYLCPHQPDDIRVLAWTNDHVRDYNTWIRKQLGFVAPFEEGEMMVSNGPIIIQDRMRASTDSLHIISGVYEDVVEGISGHILSLGAVDSEDYIRIFQPSDWKAVKQMLSTIATRAKQESDREARNKLWKQYWLIKNEWGDLRPIHAQTVHKSQGSTYREVFIDLNDIARNNKWYEVARLMYVAITRASHKVHLYGKLSERYIRKDPMAVMEAFRDGQGKNTFT